MILIANIEFSKPLSISEAQIAFDEFRETALPGTEWGLTMYNLRPGDNGVLNIDIEIENADDIETAQEKLDQFRENILPSDNYGVTIWGLQPISNTPSPSM